MGNLSVVQSPSVAPIGQVSNLLRAAGQLPAAPASAAWSADQFQGTALRAPQQLLSFDFSQTGEDVPDLEGPDFPQLRPLPAHVQGKDGKTAGYPTGVHKTGLKDYKNRDIYLAPEAEAGLRNILTIARSKGVRVDVISTYRSVEQQRHLWNNALKKYGSAAKARKWVAPPGKSRHNSGMAIDMHMYRNGRKIAQKEFDQIIAAAGMYRPMSWEGWHVEPLSTRRGRGL